MLIGGITATFLLDGMLVQCAWCKGIMDSGTRDIYSVTDFILETGCVTHGVCKRCHEEFLIKLREARNGEKEKSQ